MAYESQHTAKIAPGAASTARTTPCNHAVSSLSVGVLDLQPEFLRTEFVTRYCVGGVSWPSGRVLNGCKLFEAVGAPAFHRSRSH